MSKAKTRPFEILVDTREQAPYSFQNMPATSVSRGKPISCPTRLATLNEGDYALADAPERYVAIERKSLEDLFGTLGGRREQFEAEFERLSAYEFAAVVIESTWPEICNPSKFRNVWHSRLHPRSVFGTAASWRLRYPTIHWIAAGSRRLAEIMTYEIIQKAHKKLIEEDHWSVSSEEEGKKLF